MTGPTEDEVLEEILLERLQANLAPEPWDEMNEDSETE